jgi:hypothetical protein
MAKKTFHGVAVRGCWGSHLTADGDGVILTAIQLESSGWRGSYATARQREDSEGFWCSPATGLLVERRSIGGVFDDRVKVELFGAV